MKATGIVRRIDDLGRVVIPKELKTGCTCNRSFKVTFCLMNINNSLIL